MRLLLASTSPYRERLLQRLQLPFECVSPAVDEKPQPGECPQDLARRLALAKARAVSRRQPEALVIGSDQVADLGGRMLGKPGGHAAAREQLEACSGTILRFWTGVAVIRAADGFERFHVEPFCVHFRRLAPENIENYLCRERPYDCAGSFRWEGLGIALFERLEGSDPTALEGLPLIALTDLLAAAGVEVI